MSYNFANKVAVVTGGLSGIGLATSVALLRNGAKVIVGDLLHAEDIDPIMNNIHKKVPGHSHNLKFLRTDIGTYQDNVNLIDFAFDEFKELDYVVANASMINTTALGADETIEQFNEVVKVNLAGTFALNKLALNYWAEFNKLGSIVNVGSIIAQSAIPGLTNLCAAKGGIHAMTRTLALEYAPLGIRINEVVPGYVNTPLLKLFLGIREIDELIDKHPLGRIGEPEEIANAILFLLSDQANFITGSSLVVDGGYTVQ
ncbi:uncharacterized protein LODBEIA_P52790 [Lodderomyces beijingensis]|uniref:Uncharacterized protein n=1 Tax=Lodderomyces beijingensis TaxID=1775926 RepID=A0ABP0ZWB8_9ASCO